MVSAFSKKEITSFTDKQSAAAHLATLISWLLSWEIYLIVSVASFLQFYQFNTTNFGSDQADIFQMARYAVTHGFIPATANIAVTGSYDLPASIDILMLPAALTNDPLWAAVMVGILAMLSVLLTYGFVRCYYGRVAATLATLMYATAFLAVVYSRFIWNPNFLPLFVVLFIMALFRGVVARRKGWLFPALLLLGILIQLHPTAALMIIPLAIALILAPGTIRWRDLALGLLSLLIIYFPYFLWEISVHFYDVRILMQIFLQPQKKAVFDNQAWLLYQSFLNPYDLLSPHNPLHWRLAEPYAYLDPQHSLLWHLAPYLACISQMLTCLVLYSMATVLLLALWWGLSSRGQQTSKTKGRGPVCGYWSRLRNSPYCCGLLVLLCWQIVPLIIISHHSITLHPYYFIFFLPGPFILVGISLAKIAEWLRSGSKSMRIPRYRLRCGMYALAGLIIIAQFLGSTAGELDIDRGYYSDGFQEHGASYNDLRSLRAAVTEADQLAQRHHLNRVYLAPDGPTQAALRFLSTQMHTPVTLFDPNCVVLPSTAEGPAVMLVGPHTSLTIALIRHFATATLIDQPRRPGSAPFWLYIVTPKPEQAISRPNLREDDLQLRTSAQPFDYNDIPWLVTHWRLSHSALPDYHKDYVYTMTQFSNGFYPQSTTTQCVFTAMRAGDQVLIPFYQHNLSTGNLGATSSTISVKGLFDETKPLYLQDGPFTLLSFAAFCRISRNNFCMQQ